MEIKQPTFPTVYNTLHATTSNNQKMKDRYKESRKKKEEKRDQEEEPMNLRSLSKIMIPPLGVSYIQNPIPSRSNIIISPMDSKYMYNSYLKKS